MGDENRGIYRKFTVARTDGSSALGGKHERCNYFVLDLDHDRFAVPALKAYARACRRTYPQLAHHLDLIVSAKPSPLCGCREAMCPHTRLTGETPSEELGRIMAFDEWRSGGKP